MGTARQALGAEQFGQQRGTGGIQAAQLAEVGDGIGGVLRAQALALTLEAGVVRQSPVTGDAQAGRLATGVQGGAGGGHRLHATDSALRLRG
ncbi:hypothetical protein D3C77_678370 [compost metagenome]